MSLLDKASLIVTANAEKVGKLYSVIPSNGNADMTVVRGTTATRVNSLGLIENVAVNEPRLNYDTVGGCPAILIEPQRTNLDLTSQTFSSWTLNNSGGVTTSSVSTSNPYAFSTVSKVIPSAVLGQHRPLLNANYSSTGRFWVIAKADGYNFLSLGDGGSVSGASIIFNLSNGTISGTASGYTGEITSLGNGWYKCSMNIVFTGLTGRWVVIRDSNSTADYTGNGTSGILFAHKQMEVGSYDTSSILTLGTAITRNSDSLTRANIFTNNLITSAGGTWFIHLRNNIPYTRDANVGIWVGDNSTAQFNGNSLFMWNSASPNSRLQIGKTIAGVFTGLFTTTTAIVKIAIKWNGTTADVFQNGVKVVTATAFTTTAMEFLNLRATDVTKSINSTMLFPTPLTDTECINLTTL
jgi:hypothetical protein